MIQRNDKKKIQDDEVKIDCGYSKFPLIRFASVTNNKHHHHHQQQTIHYKKVRKTCSPCCESLKGEELTVTIKALE